MARAGRSTSAERTLWFGPRVARRPFTTFFCAAQGFGTISLDPRALTVMVIEGRSPIERLVLTRGENSLELAFAKTARCGQPAVFELGAKPMRSRPKKGPTRLIKLTRKHAAGVRARK